MDYQDKNNQLILNILNLYFLTYSNFCNSLKPNPNLLSILRLNHPPISSII